MKASFCTMGLVVALIALAAGSAQAQFGKLKDLDPTNKNSGLNKSLGNGPKNVIDRVKQTGRDIDTERRKIMDRNPQAGRDYTKLMFKNTTDKPIFLAVRFKPFQTPGNTSELKSLDAQWDGWDTKAWFRLNPGETKHVGNTNNLYVYYFAQGEGLEWSGQHYVNVRDGGQMRRIGMRTDIVGIDTPEKHTVNLNR